MIMSRVVRESIVTIKIKALKQSFWLLRSGSVFQLRGDELGRDVWINEDRFRILKQLGEGNPPPSTSSRRSLPPPEKTMAAAEGSPEAAAPPPPPPHPLPRCVHGVATINASGDGTYAMKKILIQSPEQLELVKEEIHVSSLFNHPNLLPLLDHSIIAVKGQQGGSWNYEAYVLFPVYLDGTMLDNAIAMHSRDEFFPTHTVLQIFRQLCSGLKHMHSFDPPYAIMMNGLLSIVCAIPSSRVVGLPEPRRHRREDGHLVSRVYFVHNNVRRVSIRVCNRGIRRKLTIGYLKWRDKVARRPETPYPDSLRLFIIWMLQPQPAMRPYIEDVIFHLDKLFAKLSNKPSHLVSSPTVPL
uniref:non-specific serine/threonine protein kinase n=1 Tax=Ananas comosus var. bracteatus TaxID=296719 RepID=A0A6V7P3B0_ANACO|nr:unnamed protein product [Ananas comosus var. bracteatus]